MQTIKIQVEGTEMEQVTIALDSAQVANLYTSNKTMQSKITELEKQLKESDRMKGYHAEKQVELSKEIESANLLLTALDVQEKDTHEQEYYRKMLPLVTRIALYIAKHK